ncbi:glycoside hydrolase family 78 protein [Actinotalea sp. M2MS4P-6]|uniref:alpha-L-rhamnosidase n=1 Tax=Actinotalea sp. M2MS4P-6 TaxID=2983762 RepID=UPI0021E50349|nr:alpha-L-rhamnosidase [Actinotalea sp. M2MS4P-6]MCV2394201.1 glycoside hydrolase family 78 protein [Actinotalea sp. M2MS4P-6]
MVGALSVVVDRLWAGDRGRPRHLHTARPALTWSVSTEIQDWEQASATVELRRAGVVQTQHVHGAASVRVPWPFDPLDAHATGHVRVAVTGVDGSSSEPSPWIELRTGPLGPSDWVAPFVGVAQPRRERGTMRLRTVIEVPGDVVSATLSATAHGLYVATLGGQVVGDEVMTPGWTSYDTRLAFQTYDVTGLLRPGARTVLGATVAEGWYGERYGFAGHGRPRWTGALAFAAQLRLVHADGSVSVVATGPDWQGTVEGPVLSSSIYQGETVDSRRADAALLDPDVPLPAAAPVVEVPADPERLVPAWSPPVRETEEVPVAQVLTSPSGATILDFGQNLVGRLRLRVAGPAGTTLTVRHAEVLEHGELGTRPLRYAAATDTFVLAGTGETEHLSAGFTFHGFRYAQVDGWPGDVDPDAVTAVVLHSDLVRTGHLATGDALLDQLHANVVWGMRGNFLSVPTDCPQRDERLGWTGDIEVFAPTASYLYDTQAFLGSWLRDLAADQVDGVVPFVVPNVLSPTPPPAAAWGDAATVVPTVLWHRYADRDVLARQLDSMVAWVEAIRRAAGEDLLWTGGMQFGDWLDPAAPPDAPGAARCDPDIVATAYLAHSAQLLADAMAELGDPAGAARYADLAARVRAAFRDAYVTPGGRMMSDAATGYALAIAFGLVGGEQRERVGERLAEWVRSHGYRIGTGFVGTPIVLDALTVTGHLDEAYRMLQQTENPSWLYPVTMGATTIWERWDSMLPDGTINPGEMTSFNHYALGAVADWMHRRIGGIAPAEPGYRTVEVAPRPGGRLRAASASLDTGYGVVQVAWRWLDGTFRLQVTVPPNSRAHVVLPSGRSTELGSGTHDLSEALPEPAAPVRPVDLDTPMSQVIDDDEAREALLDALRTAGYAMADGWSDRGRWRSDTTVRQAAVMIAPGQLAAAEEALAGVAARRAGGGSGDGSMTS